MFIDLSNKVVVITGGSRGIGRELSKAFSREGAKVVIDYCDSEEAARGLIEEIAQYNPHCIKVKADITKLEEVKKLYKITIKTFSRIDILINNAGICDDNLIQLMSKEQWDRVLDINLTGTYLCSRIFSKKMIFQRSGKIINIASIKGQEGSVGQVNYSASKAGVIGFTKSLAKELGKFNVTVNAVCPGFVITDLNRHNKEKQSIARRKSVLSIENSLNDLVNYILFISSDRLKGITGRVFNIDSRI